MQQPPAFMQHMEHHKPQMINMLHEQVGILLSTVGFKFTIPTNLGACVAAGSTLNAQEYKFVNAGK